MPPRTTRHKPVHPGEILRAEFLEPLGVTKYRLAKDTGMPADRVGRLVRGTRAFTADTALRLAAYFGTTAEFWMNLQARHDLHAVQRSRTAASVRRIRRCRVVWLSKLHQSPGTFPAPSAPIRRNRVCAALGPGYIWPSEDPGDFTCGKRSLGRVWR